MRISAKQQRNIGRWEEFLLDRLERSQLRVNSFSPQSNWPTFPQLFINGEFIGGCDILMSLHQTGEFRKLLIDAGIIKQEEPKGTDHK